MHLSLDNITKADKCCLGLCFGLWKRLF